MIVVVVAKLVIVVLPNDLVHLRVANGFLHSLDHATIEHTLHNITVVESCHANNRQSPFLRQ